MCDTYALLIQLVSGDGSDWSCVMDIMIQWPDQDRL